MKFKKLLFWSFSFAALCSLGVTPAAALSYSNPPPTDQSKYRSPSDMLDMIPFLGDIPRTFLFGDGYKIKLGQQDMRIDHMGRHSNSGAAQRNCMIGVSYTTPVAGFFTSRVDLPLFHSPDLALTDWSHNTVGDYVAYFSRGADDHASFRLVFTAKF